MGKALGITLTPDQQKALDDANKAKGAAGGANGKTGGAADAAAQKKLDDLAKSLGSKLNPEQLAKLKAGKLTAAEMKALGITLTPEQQKALDDANKAKGAGGANPADKSGANKAGANKSDSSKKLTPEQLEKIKSGKLTPAEQLDLAKKMLGLKDADKMSPKDILAALKKMGDKQKALDDLAKKYAGKLTADQLKALSAGKLSAEEMKKLGITLTDEQKKALDDANKAKASDTKGGADADKKKSDADKKKADDASNKKLDDLAKSLSSKLNADQLAKLKAGKFSPEEMINLGI